ncbi:M20/M25/M40 family metallo-hydrolase [soil metagenome]
MEDLRRAVEFLSSFPTRHACSRYAASAADWITVELASIPGMRVEQMNVRLVEGPRIPFDTDGVQILGVLPGSDPEMIGVGGHLDTINMSNPRSLDLEAPGANDDASGIAAMLRSARRWAEKPRRKTGLFVAFTAEEQGLLGAKALAARMIEENWPLEAFLNLDMISNTGAADMETNDREVRVYSNDHSRELARYAASAPFRLMEKEAGESEIDVKMVLRPDRIRRGGDHTPLAQAGFRAIRFTEALERYEVQHTPHDTVDHVDFGYLARVADLVANLACTLGDAQPSPANVRATRNGQGTLLTWKGDPEQEMFALWRDTRSAEWTRYLPVRGLAAALPLNLDDHEFAIGSGGVPVASET